MWKVLGVTAAVTMAVAIAAPVSHAGNGRQAAGGAFTPPGFSSHGKKVGWRNKGVPPVGSGMARRSAGARAACPLVCEASSKQPIGWYCGELRHPSQLAG